VNSDRSTSVFEILRARGVLSGSSLRVLQNFMNQWKIDQFRACLETNIIQESKMADILSDFLKLERVQGLVAKVVRDEALKLVPYNYALEQLVYPFDIDLERNKLKVAVADPTSILLRKDLSELTGKSVELVVGERSEIVAAIQRHYPLNMQLPSLLAAFDGGGGHEA
jgi:type IV pilus assembly protein PilB